MVDSAGKIGVTIASPEEKNGSLKKKDIDGPGARSGRLRPGDRVLALMVKQ